MDPSKATKVVDVFKAIFKRIAIAALETNIVLPIVTQVVGSMPSLFGITAPTGAAGGTTAGSATGSLTSSATNWGLSKAGGWAMDKMGLSSGMNNLMNTPLWGSAVSMSSTGAAAYGGTLVANPGLYGPGLVQAGSLNAANGVVNAGNTAALNASYSGTTSGAAGTAGGTLGGILGSAGAGAFGGMLRGLAGTATNSKAVGGISGAALGAGYLSSLLGLGAMGGPIGLAIAAVVGGIMGMLSTQKKSVGPNAAGNLYVDEKGAKSGPAAGDNGMDGSGMSAITDGVAQAINTIVGGVGGSYKKGLPEQNLGHITYFQEGDKWSLQNMAGGDKVGEKQTFNSQEELVQGLIRQTLQRMDQGGQVTGFNEDVRTSLRNSKATKAEDLATDVVFASGFRKDLDALTASLNPVSNQLKEFTAAAKEIGEQVKTNLLDWSAKAKELGLATDAQLIPAMRNGLMAMMGLGPIVQPLRGLDAVTKQAEINLETLKPALEAAGYTAAEQADIASRYIAKFRQDYLDGVNLIQRQGDTAVAALVDPNARLSMADRFKMAGMPTDAPGMAAMAIGIENVEAKARGGVLTFGDLRAALVLVDEQWRAGVLTAEQYQASVSSLTESWQTSMAVADAIRRGGNTVTQAIDPSGYRVDAGGMLADAGVTMSVGLRGLTTDMDNFLTALGRGSAQAGDLTYVANQLAGALRTGAITADQYTTLVQGVTQAWTTAQQTATEAARAAATRDGMRANWVVRAAELSGASVWATSMRTDLAAAQERQDAWAAGMRGSDFDQLNLVLAAERANAVFAAAKADYLEGLDRQIQAITDNTAAARERAQADKAFLEAVSNARADRRVDANISPFTSEERLADLRQQAEETYRKALDGDENARGRLIDILNRKDELARQVYAGSNLSDFRSSDAMLATLEEKLGAQLSSDERAIHLADSTVKELQTQRAQAQRMGERNLQSLDSLRTTFNDSFAGMQRALTALAPVSGQDGSLSGVISRATAEQLPDLIAMAKSGGTDLYMQALRRADALGQYQYSYQTPADVYQKSTTMTLETLNSIAQAVGFAGGYVRDFNLWLQATGNGAAFNEVVRRYDPATPAPTKQYERGGVVGAYEAGGVVGNGVWGRDSVLARYAGGGLIALAGGEGVLTAAATAAMGGKSAIDAINRGGLPMATIRPAAITMLMAVGRASNDDRALQRLDALVSRFDRFLDGQGRALRQAGEIGEDTVEELMTLRRAVADTRARFAA